MNQPHDGLLSISIVLCLVFGSGGIVAFFNGFRNVYNNYIYDKTLTFKDWILQRIFAIFMLIIIGVLIVLSILLISLGGTGLHFLVTHDIIARGKFLFVLFNVLRWLIAIFALCFGLALLYYFGNVRFKEHYRKELRRPTRKGKRYREFVIFSPGTILATTLFVLGTVGFNTYISNFSRYNALYGSIGTLIILLLWIWIVAILILAGNDLNSGIRREAERLSVEEDKMRRREIVVDALRKQIQTFERTKSRRGDTIEKLKKEMEERQALVEKLEEDNKDSELLINAYIDFVKRELGEKS
jgi:membrane protein